MPPAPLPKPGSRDARALWDALRLVLDVPRAIVVLEGALDRKTLDDVLQRATRGALGRVSAMSRAEVVARLTDLFHGHEDTATALMKELDKSCHKERHIVASIDESALAERLATYRALDFRRERARLVWALVRDGRAACTAAAGKILDESFAALAKKDDADRAIAAVAAVKDAESAADAARDASLVAAVRDRLQDVEATLAQQHEVLITEVSERAAVERERAEIVARLGSRETALRHEEQARRELSAALERATARVASLEEQLRDVDVAAVAALRADNERMRDRMRALERAAEHAAVLVDVEEALAAERGARERAEREHVLALGALDEQLRLLQARERAALHRVDELRAALKEARVQLAGQSPDPEAQKAGRVAVFVDDANLSASARRDLGSRLDYRALLVALTAGRPRALAIAFVVDNPDTPRAKHEAFVASLRDQGWDVREKRAKVRGDGTRKADWDMGMAMEMLDVAADEDAGVDVIVLGAGDGDFVPLVKRLKRMKKRVEVAAFRASTDEALIAAADSFLGLDGHFRLG